MPSQTPSQTIGPFFSHALTPGGPETSEAPSSRLAGPGCDGTLIRIEGRMTDGRGDPVPDGMIEIWQADHRGVYPADATGFPGFGRAGTDPDGQFWFETVRPGPPERGCAPHINVAVFARGMLNHAFTRMYFSDLVAANRTDPLLSSVDPDRRHTLIATLRDGCGTPTYEYSIRLQGDGETVFLDP